ncbi:MAG: type I-E CRISPR-associated protein Cas5/CasD [Erysipelotrichaceae bacterium]|nr:type I-E CRISPR-associated protein Cas5/CasD [Erysipelotrichaceae bacterium]
MKTILLKFAGPMQSWGTSSHFETRHTDFYPSKSAIIGVISASLGYKRNDDEKIRELNKISFGVRVDQQGFLMRDYHIAKKNKKNDKFETFVTNRYYLEDAVFVVAISGENELINKIENALHYPYFQPFMGRRSLPLPADFIVAVTNKTIIESLNDCEWQAAEWNKKKNSDKRFVCLDLYVDHNLADGISNMRKDNVVSFSQKERKFTMRNEILTSINVKNQYYINNTDHDVFEII